MGLDLPFIHLIKGGGGLTKRMLAVSRSKGRRNSRSGAGKEHGKTESRYLLTTELSPPDLRERRPKGDLDGEN